MSIRKDHEIDRTTPEYKAILEELRRQYGTADPVVYQMADQILRGKLAAARTRPAGSEDSDQRRLGSAAPRNPIPERPTELATTRKIEKVSDVDDELAARGAVTEEERTQVLIKMHADSLWRFMEEKAERTFPGDVNAFYKFCGTELGRNLYCVYEKVQRII